MKTIRDRDTWAPLDLEHRARAFPMQATNTARTTTAVDTGITEREVVTIAAPAEALEARLRRRFERLAELDARRVEIAARDGVVTLTGEVLSLQERDLATRSAWSTPGVTRVQNLLTVA